MAEFSTAGSTAGRSKSTTPTSGSGSSGETGDAPAGSSASFGSGIVDKVRESATAQLTTQKDRAFEGIGNVAQAVRQSTHQLREQEHDTLAGYVEQAADQIDRFARQLRDKDMTELLDDAQRLARRQPAVFVGSAFALGLLGARFVKSSTRHHDDGDWQRERYASRSLPSRSGSVRSGAAGSLGSESIRQPSPAGGTTATSAASKAASRSAGGVTRGHAGTRTDTQAPGNETGSTSDPGAFGGTNRPLRSGTDTERS